MIQRMKDRQSGGRGKSGLGLLFCVQGGPSIPPTSGPGRLLHGTAPTVPSGRVPVYKVSNSSSLSGRVLGR